ncbi:hypothetical protein DFO50_106114 [Microvirgula sp. AG722]|nr:hypothetical protein DFO50_106114 [Microvirgula sp. AG722]
MAAPICAKDVMPIPANQRELLDAIRTRYAQLDAELRTVPPAQAFEATLEGHVQGTLISVADLVAYLLGWNLLVLKWCAGRDAGREVDFPDTGFKWNELGRLAQRFYRDHAALDFPARRDALAHAHADIVERVMRETDASLYGEAWYGKYPLGRMIQLNTSSPYANARARLRKWKKARGV